PLMRSRRRSKSQHLTRGRTRLKRSPNPRGRPSRIDRNDGEDACKRTLVLRVHYSTVVPRSPRPGSDGGCSRVSTVGAPGSVGSVAECLDPTTGTHLHPRLATSTRVPARSLASVGSPAPPQPGTCGAN